MRSLREFFAEARGASAIEYALIVAFIAIIIVSGLTNLGSHVSNSYNNVSNGFR